MKTIQLPSGKKIEVVEYVEAGVIMDLQKQEDPTAFLIESLIVSIDGIKENIYQTVRKFTIADWKFLDTKLTEMVETDTEGLKS